MRDEEQHGGVERFVVDRQRLDRSVAKLDVRVLLESLLRRGEHRSGLVDGDHRPTHGASASVM